MKKLDKKWRIFFVPLVVLLAACGSGKTLIRSDPPTADITINGKYEGVTPLEIKMGCKKKSEYKIVASKDGYETKSKIVSCRLIGGLPKNIFFDIDPISDYKKEEQLVEKKEEEKSVGYGTVTVKSTPQNTKIFLDNNFIGQAPYVIPKIEAGTHELELEKEGFKSWTKKIYVVPNSVVSVNAILEEK